MKAYITVGISASGKTTWANQMIADSKSEIVDINRDNVREMIFVKKNDKQFSWREWNWKWENDVTDICDKALVACAERKCDVIISDTNLNDARRRQLISKLEVLGYTVEVKVFTIDFKEAVKRDKARKNSVGIDVIAKQLDQFNEGEFGPEKVQYSAGLESVYLCDIDGTVAEMHDRGPFDWDKVGQDKRRDSVCRTIRALRKGGETVIFFSGRDGVCRKETTDWLEDTFGYGQIELHMRAAGDMRPDHIVKKEMFDEHIRGKFNVIAVFDDRPQVCRLWRSMGVEVFQIGNQLIEF